MAPPNEPIPQPPAEPEKDADRETMRRLLAALGIDLPVNMTDIAAAVKELQGLQQKAVAAMAQLATTVPGDPTRSEKLANLTSLTNQLATAGAKFQEYAFNYFGDKPPSTRTTTSTGKSTDISGEAATSRSTQAITERERLQYIPGEQTAQLQEIFKEFSVYMRPPSPQVARLPSADEFLSDFNDAFSMVLADPNFQLGMSGLTPDQREFARTVYKEALLGKYTGALGQLAMKGESPFHLQEKAFEERFPGEAGAAVEAAKGKGVNEPTRISAGGPTRIETQRGAQVAGRTVFVPGQTYRTSEDSITGRDRINESQTAASGSTTSSDAGAGSGGAGGKGGGGSSSSSSSSISKTVSDIRSATTSQGVSRTSGLSTADILEVEIGKTREQMSRVLAAAKEGQDTAMLQKHLDQLLAIQEATRSAEERGEGVGREFIALPKIMPVDFLKQNMSPAEIKLLYEGSRRGAGQGGGQKGPTSSKRVGGVL